jgi:predicted CXXCH cytochrome family protein
VVPVGEGFTVERALLTKAQLGLDRQGRGHPMVKHPTSGPSDPLKKDKPFTCLSCHVPHGSETAKLLAFVLKPGEGICQQCHKM